MPSPIYHVGPSGLLALLAGKRVDLPVFVLANILVDFDLLGSMILHPSTSWATRYAHSLLVGIALGALWGAAAYRLKGLFQKIMRSVGLPYEPRFRRMVLSGGAGAAFHIFIDGMYGAGPRIFWPFSNENPLDFFDRRDIELFGLVCFVAAVVFWAILTRLRRRRERGEDPTPS